MYFSFYLACSSNPGVVETSPSTKQATLYSNLIPLPSSLTSESRLVDENGLMMVRSRRNSTSSSSTFEDFLLTNNKDEEEDIEKGMKEEQHVIHYLQKYTFCHSCQVVRPLRAKHCKVKGRCVREFDHFCPFIFNTVGKVSSFLF